MSCLSDSIKTPLIFVGGKGGVGKTTHAAALAIHLADKGEKVLIISTDPAHSLGDVLDTPLSDTSTSLNHTLDALELNPQNIINQHFAQIEQTIAGYANPEMMPALRRHLDAAKSAPGAEEAALLETLCRHIIDAPKQGYDRLIFDTAPTGHTLRLLELPQLMRVWTEGLLAQQEKQRRFHDAAEVLYQQTSKAHPKNGKTQRWQQAVDVLEKRGALFHQAGHRLADASYTAIIPVMTAENLPFAETKRAVAQLKQFNLPCRHLIINQLIPESQADNPFWQQRYQRQRAIREDIRQTFQAQQQFDYPLHASDIRGIDALRQFATSVL